MTTRYVIDEVGCWTGETVEWNERAPIPERTILEPPPSLEPGEFALWLGAWTVVAEKPDPPAPPSQFEANRLAVLAQIVAKVEALLAAGATIEHEEQILHVALTDASRADVGGMATTAMAAIGGAVPWPTSYSRGWITVENVRIPMPTPADGLSLAAQVGDYYASVVQNGRDLKDAVLAAEDQSDLDAIDLEAGWP